MTIYDKVGGEDDFQLLGDKPKEPVGEIPKVSAKLSWEFTYKRRVEHTDKFWAAKEEARYLEQLKQQKKIENLLKTIDLVKDNIGLINKNLGTLALVLASESCLEIEDRAASQGLAQMELIIQVLTDLYKEKFD